MIAIDTNIIVRLLTQDDLSQYKKAYNLLNKYEVFITETVILETEWVLRFAYDYKVLRLYTLRAL
jgi:predicted nucleic-acid-binding protein